jgi:hypothetical protein
MFYDNFNILILKVKNNYFDIILNKKYLKKKNIKRIPITKYFK